MEKIKNPELTYREYEKLISIVERDNNQRWIEANIRLINKLKDLRLKFLHERYRKTIG